MGYKILAINPGSTSTKVALYDEERPLLELNLRHSTEEISRFAGVNDQLDWAPRTDPFGAPRRGVRHQKPLGGDRPRRTDTPHSRRSLRSQFAHALRSAERADETRLQPRRTAGRTDRPHGGCQGLHRRPAGGRRDGRRGTHLGHADVPAQTGLPRPEPEGHGASPLRTDGLGVRRVESDRGPHGRRHFGRRTPSRDVSSTSTTRSTATVLSPRTALGASPRAN